jgi:hypothetical protein
MITLDLLDSAYHSVEIKNAAGDALAINASGEVTISNTSFEVTATDLDIRDLSAAQDNVAISDGVNSLSIDGSGNITVNAAGGSFVVTATDLDIRDLSGATDSINLNDGTNSLVINGDGSLSAVVSATDLDIRDLSAAQDNVAISDGTDTLAIETDGSINVTATRAGFGNWLVSSETVTNTESELVSTPLTGRIAVLIQNLSSQDIYLKEATGVTTANGLRLPKGSSFAADLDADSNIFAIANSGSNDIRVVEYAS